MFYIKMYRTLDGKPGYYAGRDGEQGTLQFATDINYAMSFEAGKFAERLVTQMYNSREEAHFRPRTIYVSK
jgi:hypothetical protein